jgi:hypothetical protein
MSKPFARPSLDSHPDLPRSKHALEAVSGGRLIVVVDDHDRETADWDDELGSPETAS